MQMEELKTLILGYGLQKQCENTLRSCSRQTLYQEFNQKPINTKTTDFKTMLLAVLKYTFGGFGLQNTKIAWACVHHWPYFRHLAKNPFKNPLTKGLILGLANKTSQSLQTFWLQYHNLIGATRFFVNAHRLGVSSQGPALPDVPATVVHQVEHLSPLQVWLFHSGFVRLLIAGSPIPHLHLHPRRVTLKLLPFLPLLTADIPARKTIQYFLFPSPTLLPDRPPPKKTLPKVISLSQPSASEI